MLMLVPVRRPHPVMPPGLNTQPSTPNPAPSTPQGWLDKYAGAVHAGTQADGATVVGVLPGPHAAPDYFKEEAMEVFYSTPYEVHYNSNRWAGARGACRGRRRGGVRWDVAAKGARVHPFSN